MAARTQSHDPELSRLRAMRIVAIVLAVVAVAVLIYGFGMGWMPWYQVPAGLAAYAAVEWQRQYGKKIRSLEDDQVPRS